ncbi:hypothetical protein BO85DRAFT_86844 [Aspergillus piperis CBS 112811]|uniref:Uncharacterized protein n=1 Tax=Aspergillus piperis CBS 112811 TaxID=1448313 RepID=A0A8G1QWE9_9EURO|nr:hypothetical protein BO85DRAFT_86844 [Aspergillus piperis CBS 112811]RAH54909.1 hypothetical protein BO85DRAFT_86844 [Aspergillus piperis CBS 112811]
MGRKLEISPGRHHRMNKHLHCGGFLAKTADAQSQTKPSPHHHVGRRIILNAASSTSTRRSIRVFLTLREPVH